MTDNNAIKTIFANAIDGRIDEIKRISLDILNHPESGYREYRTSRLVADWFRTNGFHVQTDVAKTGVISTLETGRPGPHVVVMGELDALIVPKHLYADRETGAAPRLWPSCTNWLDVNRRGRTAQRISKQKSGR